MMVFWKAGLVFLAVPKTGTHAYHAALSDRADIVLSHPPGLKHMNAQRYLRKFKPLLGPGAGKLSMMAVIREPLDWLGSWYRYRSRPYLDGKPNSTAGVDFTGFVRAYLSDDPPDFARLGSQFGFVTDAKGQVRVPHLFAYEQQSQLRQFLEARLDCSLPKPAALNLSPERELDLDPEVEAALRIAHAADFDLHAEVLLRNN